MKKFAFSLFLFFIFSSSAFAEECDFNKASESVVKIYTPSGSVGTGSLVDLHGKRAVLTASHVIDPWMMKITIFIQGVGYEFRTKELYRSFRDILILDIPESISGRLKAEFLPPTFCKFEGRGGGGKPRLPFWREYDFQKRKGGS